MAEPKLKNHFFRTLVREPFLQFIVLGGVIFLISGWAENQRQNQAGTIRVDTKMQTRLENLYSAQFGYSPGPEVLENLINNYIREEVLFRDALKLDLAKQDEIIRRRLVQKMEYLMLDGEKQTGAPEEALRTWYKNHLANYEKPPRVSFKHIYFEEKVNNPARQRALRALPQVEKEHVGGDNFPLNSEYTSLSPKEAAQLFGHSEFIEKVFAAPVGQWTGPWQSGYGWHLVYIKHRSEAETMPFEEVKARVFDEWRKDDQQKRFALALKEREKAYTIIREPNKAPSFKAEVSLR